MLLRRARFGVSECIHDLTEKRPLALQKLRPRLIYREPVHPVDLRILPDVARPLRPFEREGVADRAVQVEVYPHRERGDDFAARLAQRRQVDARPVGGRFADFLFELTAGGEPAVFALDVLSFRDRPSAVVPLGPEWTARMPDQYLNAPADDPIQQQSRTELRHHARA